MFWVSLVVLYITGLIRFLYGNIHVYFSIVAGTYGTIAHIAIAVILIYSVFVSKGIWFKLLNSKVMNYIGILSYSIYLWQQLFIIGLSKEKYWVAGFPQNLFFIFVMALFSHYVIEKPFLKLKEKFKQV